MIKKFKDYKLNEDTNKPSNYMFFENIKTIKRYIDSICELDEKSIDNILEEHKWATEHITTSKDDIEEVYNFLINTINK